MLNTFDLVVGALFAMSNIHKIKCCLALRKTQGKILEIAFALDTSVASHSLGEARQVRIDGSDYFHIVCVFAALGQYRGTEGVGSFLATVHALADEVCLKLDGGCCE